MKNKRCFGGNMENNNLLATLVNAQSSYRPKRIPSSQEITYLSKETGTTQLWKIDRKSANSIQLSDLEEMVTGVWHSPSGKQTIVGIDHQGNEIHQLLLLNHLDGNIEKLVYSPEYLHNFGCWSPDGNRVAWASNRINPKNFEIYIQHVESKEFEKIYEFERICVPIYWFSNGEKLIVSVECSNIDNELYVLDIQSRKVEKLIDTNHFARFKSLQVLQNEEGAYVVTDLNRNTAGLYFYSFITDQLTEIVQHENWDIEEAVLSSNEEKIAYTVNVDGYSSLRYFDLVAFDEIIVQFPQDGVIQSLSWCGDDEILFDYTNPQQPTRALICNISTEESIYLTCANDDIQSLCVRPELHSYRSFDNTEIPFFYFKKSKKKSPMIIYVHGGPEAQYRPEYDPGLQYLYQCGFAVVAPNIRGSLGYGRENIKKDDHKNRLDALKDIVSLADNMVASGNACPDNLVIMGHSYGGFSTLLALTHYPEKWVAGVDIMGMSSLNTFFDNISIWRKELRQFEYGDLKSHTDFFHEIAPLTHARKIEAPLFVVHGQLDTRVPLTESTQIVANLRDNDQVVEYLEYDDEGHFMEKLVNIQKMYAHISSFLKKHTSIK